MNRRQFAAAVWAASAAVILPVIPALGREPIRCSADKDDPGFDFYMRNGGPAKKWHVYLDGEEVQHVITADEGEGFIRRLLTDADGRFYLDPVNLDRAAEETVYGRVEIAAETCREYPVISA